MVLAHRNLVATMKCLMFMVMPRDDIYIAFLPLAHVLELLAENTMMLFGVKVGFTISHPHRRAEMISICKELVCIFLHSRWDTPRPTR